MASLVLRVSVRQDQIALSRSRSTFLQDQLVRRTLEFRLLSRARQGDILD